VPPSSTQHGRGREGLASPSWCNPVLQPYRGRCAADMDLAVHVDAIGEHALPRRLRCRAARLQLGKRDGSGRPRGAVLPRLRDPSIFGHDGGQPVGNGRYDLERKYSIDYAREHVRTIGPRHWRGRRHHVAFVVREPPVARAPVRACFWCMPTTAHLATLLFALWRRRSRGQPSLTERPAPPYARETLNLHDRDV
jgi:hypothetical protein